MQVTFLKTSHASSRRITTEQNDQTESRMGSIVTAIDARVRGLFRERRTRGILPWDPARTLVLQEPPPPPCGVLRYFLAPLQSILNRDCIHPSWRPPAAARVRYLCIPSPITSDNSATKSTLSVVRFLRSSLKSILGPRRGEIALGNPRASEIRVLLISQLLHLARSPPIILSQCKFPPIISRRGASSLSAVSVHAAPRIIAGVIMRTSSLP